MPKSTSSAENFATVTPHATNPLVNGAAEPITTRGIIVAVAGTVSCKNAEGTFVDIYCAAGVVIPIVTGYIKIVGTTATGIVALW